MKRNLLFVALAIAAVAGVLMSTSQAAEKIEVCHYNDGHGYELIEVGSQSAADSHVANHQYEAGGDFIVDLLNPCPEAE